MSDLKRRTGIFGSYYYDLMALLADEVVRRKRSIDPVLFRNTCDEVSEAVLMPTIALSEIRRLVQAYYEGSKLTHKPCPAGSSTVPIVLKERGNHLRGCDFFFRSVKLQDQATGPT
jgi:hypothetical protein